MKSQRTRSQDKVLNLLISLNRAISAQDLYLELRKTKQEMGLATVYRSLEALKLEGVVNVRTLPSGESLYSYVTRDNHHLTCVNCNDSIPFTECPVHDLEHRLEDSHHFKIYYHTLEFFGICEKCQLLEINK